MAGTAFTFLRYFRPFRIGKLVLAHSDSLLHAGRDGQAVVGVEGGVPAQPAPGEGAGSQHIAPKASPAAPAGHGAVPGAGAVQLGKAQPRQPAEQARKLHPRFQPRQDGEGPVGLTECT